MDVAALNGLTREEFVARLARVFEHSPWVAEQAAGQRPFASRAELRDALAGAVRAAPRERRLALIRAHPDLAGKAAIAGELTAESGREQAAAGLDRLTPEQFARLTELNATYRERFGFPYVVCAREHDADSIIADASLRVGHDPETEEETALSEIEKIADGRLEQLAAAPRISYGKLDVPVHVVSEAGLLACEVSLEVLGDAFLASYTEGDNSRVVATDTMKNVILRHALEQDPSSLQSFVEGLAHHFLQTYADMEGVRVTAVQLPFEPVTEKLFRRVDAERAEVEVELGRAGAEVLQRPTRTSIRGLRLLKTTGSAFTRFARDGETTLPERVDRPLFVFMDVDVRHVGHVAPDAVRQVVFEVFDEMVSESIQQLVYAMGHRLFDVLPEVSSVSFAAQNHTHDPVPGSPDAPALPRAYTTPFPAWGNITLTLER